MATRTRMTPEARRAQLLDVLADLIVDEGFAAVTIDRVARGASVARTVVYAQFGSLDGMLEALVDRTQEQAIGQVERALASSGARPEPADVDAAIVTSVRAFAEMVVADPRTWRLALLRSDGAPAVLRERTAASRRAIHGLLTPSIAWLIEQRGGLEAVESDLATRAIITLGEDAARLLIEDAATYPPSRMAEFIAALLRTLRTAHPGR